MGAIREKIRFDVRMRWKGLVAIALVIGASSGVMIAADAAARRTDSVLGRFNHVYRLPDQVILVNTLVPNPFLPTPEQIRAIPGVRKAMLLKQVVLPLGRNQREIGGLIAQDDEPFGRVRLLEGRFPSHDRADEIVVGFGAAKQNGWRVGQTIPTGARSLAVVGIVAAADALPQVPSGGIPFIGSRAMFDAFPPTTPYRIEVYLEPGAARAFQRGVEQLSAGRRFTGVTPARNVILVPTQRAFHLQASALRLLAIVGGLSLALVFGQTLSRQASLLAADSFVWRALGMTRRQHWLSSTVVLGGVGVIAGIVAAIVAFLISPVAPLGDAGAIELQPGLRFDAAAIGLGVAVVSGGVLMLSALFCSRAIRRASKRSDASAERFGGAAGSLARAGFSASAVVGARFAFDRSRGRIALPTRTTIAEAALCVAGFAMALVCLGGLDHFLSTPRLYGKWWDAKVTFDGADARAHESKILGQPGVTGLAYGVYHDRLVVNGVAMHGDRVSVPVRGSISQPVVEGRMPSAPDEIAFGRLTMRQLGVRVGDIVSVSAGLRPPVSMRVVGAAVFEVTLPLHGLGSGSVITFEGGERLGLGLVPAQAFVSLDERTTSPEAFLAELAQATGAEPRLGTFSTPSSVLNFASMRALPAVLAGILGVFGVATLLHAMVSVIRFRRRDLAILKAIGFDRAQIARTVAWQATLIVGVAAAIGIPLGILAGRFLWLRVVADVGGAPVAHLPALSLAAIVPAALLVANLIAAIPGRRAAATPAAPTLRTE